MQHMAQNAQIEILRRKIENLKERLPAHSIKPHMLQELERLEEELEALLKSAIPSNIKRNYKDNAVNSDGKQ